MSLSGDAQERPPRACTGFCGLAQNPSRDKWACSVCSRTHPLGNSHTGTDLMRGAVRTSRATETQDRGMVV